MTLNFPIGNGTVVFHHQNRPDDGYTHVAVRFFFADVTNLQAFTNEINGVTGTPTADDIGSIARVGGADPYTFYILRGVTGAPPYTWQQIDGAGGGGGSGDVVGPLSATANTPAIFDGATGKLIKQPNADVDLNAQAIINVGNVDGRDVSADGTKLDGVEVAADVTDEANVLAALSTSGAAKNMGGGAITGVGAVDGRDVSADGAQLDANTGALATHIADGANPHATDVGNLGAGTLAELNGAITDATLDANTGSRPPNGAAGGDLAGTYPNPTVSDGADGSAIHNNVAGEINAIATKATPVNADVVVLEDSAAGFVKVKATLGSLPGGGGGGSGDVVGPASATANRPAVFDGATGKLIKEPNAAVDLNGQNIISVGTVDGRDVSADGVTTDANVAAIVAHVTDGANPHATDVGNLGTGTLAELNAAITDATLDANTGSRPPNGAAGGDLAGTYPNPTVDDGADGSAIHDDVAGEINAIALKALPVGADVIVLEDSANSFAKARAPISSISAVRMPMFDGELPAAAGAVADAFTDQLCTTYLTGVTQNGRFRFELPQNYRGGSLRVRVRFAPSNTNTNNFRLQISFMRQELGHDMSSTTFATARLTTETPAGVANILAEATDTFTNAQADAPAAGDMMMVNIQREGADVADTFTGDVRVYSVIVEEV